MLFPPQNNLDVTYNCSLTWFAEWHSGHFLAHTRVVHVLLNELSKCTLRQHEADSALKKARLLQAQRQEEYEKAKVSTSRLEEEQMGGGGGAAAAKQLEKRRRLEEEALQKVGHLF